MSRSHVTGHVEAASWKPCMLWEWRWSHSYTAIAVGVPDILVYRHRCWRSAAAKDGLEVKDVLLRLVWF